jgi:hypothetical protein
MRTYPSLGVAAATKLRAEMGPCRSGSDGECSWKKCPQAVRYRTGCPLFDWSATPPETPGDPMKTARETIHPVLYRDGNCGARLLDIDEGHSRLCDQLTATIEERDRALTATGPGSGATCEECAPIAKSFDNAKAMSLESYHRAHPAAPQTDHRAAPACGERHPRGGGYGTCCLAAPHSGVAHRNYGGDEWGAPTSPPSGSPPGAAEDVCPTCHSPDPHMFPATQEGGEVAVCRHMFHRRVTPQNTAKRIAEREALFESVEDVKP